MLVLSRKAGEEIVVSNGHITISLLEITRNKVRLGISAPSGTPVHRKEVHDQITPAVKRHGDPEEDAAGFP